MSTKLPGTLDDGPSLKSDASGGGDILAFKVNLGDTGTDGGFVRVGNGLPILSDGDVVTSAPAFSTFQGTVDSASAFRLTAQAAKRMVMVKAMNTNTGTVFLGGASTVTSANGFELGPGQSVWLPVDNSAKIWCIASTDGQKVCWTVI